jgi:predicted transcriptional regulator
LKKREPILIQMEILASLFASPKVVTRLAQSCNVNMTRIGSFVEPMLARGLIRTQTVDARRCSLSVKRGTSCTRTGLRLGEGCH